MKFLRKGRPVFVNGELESWRSEGKFGINFVATNVQFLGGSKDAGQAGEAQGQGANQDGWDAETRQWAEDFGSDIPN
jgi:single-stranded DNA-binding protein